MSLQLLTNSSDHHGYTLVTTSTSDPGQQGNGPYERPNENHELEPIKRTDTALAMNVGLIIGISLGVVLLLLVAACILVKVKYKDEGSYKVEENYVYETCNAYPPLDVNGGISRSPSSPSTSSSSRPNIHIKEWYV